MKTYNEYEEHKDKDLERFIKSAIDEYVGSEDYQWAIDGVNYTTGENTEIKRYQRILYNVKGQAMIDTYTPNHKIPANFFGVFVRQRAAYVLGNGIEFESKDKKTKDKLGRGFDHKLLFAGQDALAQAVVYGFWNKDHVEFYPAKEICPIFDDESGDLKVVIHFWRVQPTSPMRITLFEKEGITEYRTPTSKDSTTKALVTLKEREPYIKKGVVSDADGKQYGEGENYSELPIVPMYANRQKTSYLKGLKEKIDDYDLLTSGLVNDADSEFVYWTLKGQGAMNDDITLQQFVEKMRVLKAAVVGDNEDAVPHSIEPPTNAKLAAKEALRADLYRDAMALDTEVLKAGSVTATQINAAYEPLNEAADEFEYCVIEFVLKLLNIIGIDDYPKFTRSIERNKTEETQMVLSAAGVLDNDTIIDKLPFLTPEEKEDAKNRATAEQMNMVNMGMNEGE